MKIQLSKLNPGIGPDHCYVHARGLILPDGFGLITMQKLELSGDDVFYGLEMVKNFDSGKTFTIPISCKNLTRTYCPDGKSIVMSDATPFYHKKTGKIILTGHTPMYDENNYIFAAEWMQSWHGSWDVCSQYGSDNTIFVAKVCY